MMDQIGPPAAHVVEEELDGDIVLYDSQRLKYYELNPTASDVWRLATGDFTFEEIVEKLSIAYQMNQDEIRLQVAEVIEMMRKAHLFTDIE